MFIIAGITNEPRMPQSSRTMGRGRTGRYPQSANSRQQRIMRELMNLLSQPQRRRTRLTTNGSCFSQPITEAPLVATSEFAGSGWRITNYSVYLPRLGNRSEPVACTIINRIAGRASEISLSSASNFSNRHWQTDARQQRMTNSRDACKHSFRKSQHFDGQRRHTTHP